MDYSIIIYPEIEPGVISKEMIEDAYLNIGYKGEALRLHQLEPVKYDSITRLRLEHRNILRIDHLWMMPNLEMLSLNHNKIEVIENVGMLTKLKELNLSFNYIEKIENLHTLKKLEVLSLFNNLITVIEGLDKLENLVIFSLGNNKLESLDGLERLRFLNNLKVFNLEGNPVSKTLDYPLSSYIAAVLPNLKYYNYICIEESVKQEAAEKFYRELRQIQKDEEEELEVRQHQARELEGEKRLSSSFVEYLNEHQLYESLWEEDEDGKALLEVGGEALDELLAEYRGGFFALTQEIYKLGLEKFEERKNEIELYEKSVEAGQMAIQKFGHDIIAAYVVEKEQVFAKAAVYIKETEARTMKGEDEDSPEMAQLAANYDSLYFNFHEKTDELWNALMSDELHLYESIMEVTALFQRNIQEMMSKFVEQTQTYFAQIRDVAVHFSENLTDIVQQYISLKLATRVFDDVPEGLKICLEDKDAVNSMIAGMKDHHIQRIDEREDRLIVRSRQFIADLIDRIRRNELNRNRTKVLEINSFTEKMTNSMQDLAHEIRDQIYN